MKDNISDMLTRIRNGQQSKMYQIVLFWPTPKICIKILDILKNEGFIRGYSTIYIKNKKSIIVFLKYTSLKKPLINKIKRISTPGRRVYVKSNAFWKINNGIGVYLVTTSTGIKTDVENRFLNQGGEVLFYIE